MVDPPADTQQKSRILLVDDDPSILETSKMMLELLGYEVTGVTSSEEGLNAISCGAFDLVLTDLDMPKQDGREFSRIAKSQGLTAPVVVVSGYLLEEGDWQDDFDGVLMKPFRIQDLQDKVTELLNK